jgi:hypothetical protein
MSGTTLLFAGFFAAALRGCFLTVLGIYKSSC